MKVENIEAKKEENTGQVPFVMKGQGTRLSLNITDSASDRAFAIESTEDTSIGGMKRFRVQKFHYLVFSLSYSRATKVFIAKQFGYGPDALVLVHNYTALENENQTFKEARIPNGVSLRLVPKV